MPAEIQTALGELLRTWGREAANLCAISEQIQTILVLACNNASEGQAFHREAQACDLLTQSLSAMSGFMLTVADAVPQDQTIDIALAVSNLPLGDLAAMVSSLPRMEAMAGEVEIFL